MSKIPPKILRVTQSDPAGTPTETSQADPASAPSSAQDSLQKTSTSPLPLSSSKDPAPTAGAFSAPVASDIADAASVPEKVELFTIGKARMSGDDIKRTIGIVREMETIIGRTVVSLLKEQSISGGAPRQHPDPRIRRTIPGPDGQPRTIDFRGPRDQIDSVKEATFSKESRLKLLALAQSLPPHTNLEDLDTRAGDFQTECIALLSIPGTPLYEMKQLLPLEESGSLVSSDPDRGQKPVSTYTRLTSKMLYEQAIAIGALKEDQ